MKVEDLIPFGSLGKYKEKTEDFSCSFFQNAPGNMDQLKEVFLIFKDKRGRFVDVVFSGNRISIPDSDIRNDLLEDKGTRIALTREDLEQRDFRDRMIPKKDIEIVFNGEIIGKLIDSFDNHAHVVLVVELNNGKEIMIPFVDLYVGRSGDNCLHVMNIKDLLEL